MFNSSLSRLSEWAFHGLRSVQTRFKVVAGKASDESGAITIEYILIIALIAIIIITLFTILLWPALRPAIVTLLGTITEAIGGGAIQ
jgi:Flp pilus assembly pilin Flp